MARHLEQKLLKYFKHEMHHFQLFCLCEMHRQNIWKGCSRHRDRSKRKGSQAGKARKRQFHSYCPPHWAVAADLTNFCQSLLCKGFVALLCREGELQLETLGPAAVTLHRVFGDAARREYLTRCYKPALVYARHARVLLICAGEERRLIEVDPSS